MQNRAKSARQTSSSGSIYQDAGWRVGGDGVRSAIWQGSAKRPTDERVKWRDGGQSGMGEPLCRDRKVSGDRLSGTEGEVQKGEVRRSWERRERRKGGKWASLSLAEHEPPQPGAGTRNCLDPVCRFFSPSAVRPAVATGSARAWLQSGTEMGGERELEETSDQKKLRWASRRRRNPSAGYSDRACSLRPSWSVMAVLERGWAGCAICASCRIFSPKLRFWLAWLHGRRAGESELVV
jgi:hypothetical protein